MLSKPKYQNIKGKRLWPKQVYQTLQHLRNMYQKWRNAGKLKNHPSHLEYKTARSEFQAARRRYQILQFVKSNNQLMRLNRNDRNKFYSIVKQLQGQSSRQDIQELHTPAGAFYGTDVLEGFATDAEFLGRHVGQSPKFDNDFYNLCIEDNQYIFELKEQNPSGQIPQMSMTDLNRIIDQEMKVGKACDVYHLTPEHLKHTGPQTRKTILRLINSILNDMYYLSCPQIKVGLGSAVYKGKKKPPTQSSSYRRITVTPQIGSIIDRYIEPKAEGLFKTHQSSEQYGFTKHITYLMASVLRGECQRWALDTKQTCFGISFDGKAAFPSVDRDIQIRES